ncbi:MAG: YfiR family protein [Burkholderiales bacterium]|nr:YfiR family protein [Nitrosomonas sp.]MCP5273759.1 YfiR family protein [Burkholderiales bacterium]
MSVSLRARLRKLLIGLFLGIPLSFQLQASPDAGRHIDEYGIKAAFIFNFIAFTQWPDSNDQILNLCIYGEDYFGAEIDRLQERTVNHYAIEVTRLTDIDTIQECQILFVSKSEIGNLSVILSKTDKKPVLTIADSQGAARHGVIINMNLVENKIKFEINLESARSGGLHISSKLLQLATQIY